MNITSISRQPTISNVVLDEGWSNDWDLLKRNTDIDLPGLVAHAREKWWVTLWSTWYAISQDMEGLCSTYAGCGYWRIHVPTSSTGTIKGDRFLLPDRGDRGQIPFDADFHGMFPPQVSRGPGRM